MKKATIFVSFALLLGLAACGSKNSNSDVEQSFNESIDSLTEMADSLSKLQGEASAAMEASDDAADEPVATEDEQEEASESGSSSEFDEYLTSYEEYVDEYIEFLKKAKSGDADALAQYPAMLQKAQALGEKMESLKGDVTPADYARFSKIQAKLLKAAQGL